MPDAIKRKPLVIVTATLSAAAVTAASIYTVWHAGAGVSQIVAWQAMPAGVHVIKKQITHLWPHIATRLNIAQKENSNANT